MGPKQVGTKEYGKMIQRIQVLGNGRVPAKEARNWKIEGQKKRITRKEYQRLQKIFEMEGFMAHKRLWNLATEKVLQDRGALPKEEGDVLREYKAMSEEDFLSSWEAEGKVKEERTKEMDRMTREEEKEENETEINCVGSASAEAFDIFS